MYIWNLKEIQSVNIVSPMFWKRYISITRKWVIHKIYRPQIFYWIEDEIDDTIARGINEFLESRRIK